MIKRLRDLLLRRAEKLFKDSIKSYEEGFYDLALVYLEQSLQLFLKVEILEKYSKFPKTHNLRVLFEVLNYDLSDDELLVVDLLEDTYISGRYLEKEYSEEEYKRALEFEKLKKHKIDLERNKDKYFKNLEKSVLGLY
ncbi:MAG TPA: HEPN domain-containing protein [Candidatus Nanopusillus sp.]|nr:HEPN domain-containing protein [Candidatus Nanopusillus sp.]